MLSESPASARTTHDFESQIGGFSKVEALTVNSGDLYTAERSALDEFDASTSKPIAQLPQQPLVGLGNGVGFSRPAVEAEMYVGVGEADSEYAVAVFGGAACGTLACAPLQKVWTGAETPNKSFTGIEEGVSRVPKGRARVAVDDSTSLADWAGGDVFVATRSEFRGAYPQLNIVDVFRPIAGGGEEYVTQLKGTPLQGEPATGEGESFSDPMEVAVSGFNGDVLVVDSREAGSEVDVFEPVGISGYAFVGRLTPPSGSFKSEVNAVAVDGSNDGSIDDGDIYVAEDTLVADGVRSIVYEFSAAGVFLGAFTGEEGTGAGEEAEEGPSSHRFDEVTALAVDPVSHRVFAGDLRSQRIGEDEGVVDVFGPNLTSPEVAGQGPAPAALENGRHSWRVQFNGSVNPENAGDATCWFAWGTSRALDKITPCEGTGESTKEPVLNGEVPVSVHASVPGLEPGTTYYYRLEAKNAQAVDTGEGAQDVEFLTPGPGFHGESVSDVSSSSATLEATIDPNERATSYHFEYDVSAHEAGGPSQGANIPLKNASVGAGNGDIAVQQHVQGLLPSTAYHYRVVAVSEVELGVFEEFYGADQTFTTQNAGGSLTLLDGRSWELVSPANKHGGLLLGLVKAVNSFQAPIQAAADGRSVTYAAATPTESEVSGYSGVEQVFSRRSGEGASWSSRDISPPHDSRTGLEPYSEYERFSEDLSLSLVNLTGSDGTLLSPLASEVTPYTRQTACEPPAGTGACYVPLVSGKEGEDRDVPAGTVFGGSVGFVGATTDMSHVVLRSSTALTDEPTGGYQELYEWSEGEAGLDRFQLLSLLPEDEGGGPATSSSVDLGNNPAEVWSSGVRAVSSDGSRVFWSAGGDDSAQLYMRDVAKGETIRLDVAQPGAAGGPADALFESASSDGLSVFFTDTARLTPDASGQGADLYECDIVEVAGRLGCVLSDRTPGAHGASEVQNLALGSEDGSYAYFVANGVLAGSEAPAEVGRGGCQPGSFALATCNLYVYHDGRVRFIATLSSEDELDWGSQNAADHSVGELTARVSPNGRYFAFMSVRSLTGYDNRDVNSGQPDAEVFLYDAQTGKLICVSCDPTGARPAGVELGAVLANGGADLAAIAQSEGDVYKSGAWIAGNIPTGTAIGLYHESLYLSRSLSDSGRLFFNSSDGLVPADVNGQEDVYEYEPGGVGGCSTSSPKTTSSPASSPLATASYA